MPILDKVAITNTIFDIYLLLPLAIAVGYGVILPIASPSNAVLYTSGYLSIKDMVISGIVLKIFALAIIYLFINTVLFVIFNDNTNLVTTSNSTTVSLDFLSTQILNN